MGGGSDAHVAPGKPAGKPAASPAAPPAAEPAAEDKEARFLAALQRMMGGEELTDEGVRSAMASLTSEQRQELLRESKGLKQDLMTKEEHKDDRVKFLGEINRSAEANDMPVDKDGEFLAKKVQAYMSESSEEPSRLLLLEALAASPYLVKAALAEARDSAVPAGAQGDLAEVEAALGLLKVDGWREGDATSRPPVVRRNLLLLHQHMHQQRLKGLTLHPSTWEASASVVDKARRLLDILFGYALQCRWVKAVLAITSLQALLVTGLWDPEDDDCRDLHKAKLAFYGLKQPKLSIRADARDVGPGETVTIKVVVSRTHAHSEAELAEYNSKLAAEGALQQQQGGADDADGVDAAPSASAEANEGWFLLAEAVRTKGTRALPAGSEVVHNQLVGRQPLSTPLDSSTMSAEIAFEAPSQPGEYKIVVHVRSASMVSVDARRKVSFTVLRSKRSLPSSSSGASTETTDSAQSTEVMEMEQAIAEMHTFDGDAAAAEKRGDERGSR